jgi:hypothetical protein
MKKSELRTGMVVELRNCTLFQVLLSTPHGHILQDEVENTSLSSCIHLSEYNEDLTHRYKLYEQCDIMKVWGTNNESARAYSAPFDKFTRLLWTRPEEYKEITTEDAIKLAEVFYGCKVKIVK